MKLTANLPIALSLACAMMLSSCSHEDAVAPQPMSESVGEYSGAKENAEVQPPYMAHTLMPEVNWNLFPRDWQKTTPAAGSINQIPAGSSSLTSLWGHLQGWSVATDPSWVKPLPPVPGNSTAKSMITVISYAHTAAETDSKSSVFTTLGNLKPGKTYSVSFYVATTTVTSMGVNAKSVCATSAEIKMFNVDNGSSTSKVLFGGKEGEWIKKTITFKALSNNAKFSFSGYTPLGNVYSYIHLFVPNNSLKELTAFQPVITQPMNL